MIKGASRGAPYIFYSTEEQRCGHRFTCCKQKEQCVRVTHRHNTR